MSVLHDQTHGRDGGASGRCGDSAGTNAAVPDYENQRQDEDW